MINNKLLKVPCPTQITARIPYLAEQGKFGMPVIFCNEHMLPFLFSNKSVLLETSPDTLGAEKEAALKTAIERELQEKSVNASSIKRQPTKGRNAAKIILTAAGIAGGVAAATLFVIPGGISILLGAVGLFAGSAIPATATAATAFTVATVAGAAGAGATSSVYFIARAVIPRKIKQRLARCMPNIRKRFSYGSVSSRYSTSLSSLVSAFE